LLVGEHDHARFALRIESLLVSEFAGPRVRARNRVVVLDGELPFEAMLDCAGPMLRNRRENVPLLARPDLESRLAERLDAVPDGAPGDSEFVGELRTRRRTPLERV